MNDKNLNLKQIPELTQRQDSTVEQLQDLKTVATRLGMYDAADVIQRHIDGNHYVTELQDALDSLCAAVNHYLNCAHPLAGFEIRDELRIALQVASLKGKKPNAAQKMKAKEDREIAIEQKFEAFWAERSEMFRKEFGSASIARDLWEHAADLCKDIPHL